MTHYFWDTGVAIGYMFHVEVPTGLKQTHIDKWSAHACAFVKRFESETHVLSALSEQKEIPAVKRKLLKRLTKCQQIIDGHDKGQVLAGCDSGESAYINNIVQRQSKHNKAELIEFLSDIKVNVLRNEQHLMKHVIKITHSIFDSQVKQFLDTIIQNPNDSLVYACAIHYFNLRQEVTEFITCDINDFVTPKIEAQTRQKFAALQIPKVVPLPNISGYVPSL